MCTTDFVESYFDAWNHRDPQGVADHLARKGYYHDIPEHTRRTHDELVTWLADFFAHYRHRYELMGEVLRGDNTLAFQYRMIPDGTAGPQQSYHGAEFVTLCDDGALQITDYYDAPGIDTQPLSARSSVAERAKYAKSGLDDRQLRVYKTRLEQVMCAQQAFLQPNLTLPLLAELVGCSVNHLSQVINAGFGTSFFDYLNAHRVRYARDLLKRPDGSKQAILNIAFSVGFNSNSAFYAAFKKHVGQTPASYRRDQAGSGN
ncbi:MAG: helix-turn-helix domain-containing protein [Woeseia sp.]